jgi:hypothetical protein
MTAWFVRRARAAWLLGAGLVVAGFVPVLLFMGAALLPAAQASSLAALYPEIPREYAVKAQTWLKKRRIDWTPTSMHAGLALAGAGLLVMMLGGALVGASRPALDADRRRRDDARRRAQHYRGAGRVEPTFSVAAANQDEQRAA